MVDGGAMEPDANPVISPAADDAAKLRRTIRRSVAAVIAVLMVGGGIAWHQTRPRSVDDVTCYGWALRLDGGAGNSAMQDDFDRYCLNS